MTDPVVIAAFQVHAEAVGARDAIVAEGLVADVSPRSDTYPRMCDDAFEQGFDLVVDREDAASALAIVRRLWPDEPRAAGIFARCPACDSAEVARLPRLRLFVITAVLLLIAGEVAQQRDLFLLVIGIVAVLLLMTPPMRCRTCGERWRGHAVPALDDAREGPPVICPSCGSEETEIIPRRRERAWTLLVNYILPPLILIWPLRPNRRCVVCAREWR